MNDINQTAEVCEGVAKDIADGLAERFGVARERIRVLVTEVATGVYVELQLEDRAAPAEWGSWVEGIFRIAAEAAGAKIGRVHHGLGERSDGGNS